MSEIRKGDLVMVVNTERCGCVQVLGKVFRVVDVQRDESSWCGQCDAKLPTELSAADGTGAWFSLRTLRRIDPPAEQTDTTTDEELTA